MKHGSGVTLLLTGHTTGTSLPIYQSGSLLSGIAVLDKPACVTSLEIKVRSLRPPLSFLSRGISYSPPQQLEGIVSVREIQGGGSSNVVFFSDQLLTWDTASSCLLDELSFRRVVPAASHDGRLLQPTFDSRLNGIPGFRVSIRWQVVLTVMRSRTGPLSLLRKTTRYVYLQCPTWRLLFMGLMLMWIAMCWNRTLQTLRANCVHATDATTCARAISDDLCAIIAYTPSRVVR